MLTEIPLGSAIAIIRRNMTPSRFCMPSLLLLATLFWARPSAAKTYYVGTCKTGSYSTIGEAIENAPADSTIMICPGTYAEDLVISKPLTLRGFRVGTSSQVLIQPPLAGSLENSISFSEVYPIVFVNAGPVNLSNITVSAPTSCPSSTLVGIFYSDGFGTIDHVTMDTEADLCPQIGEIAILLENGTSTVSTTTVEDSNFYQPSAYGIFTCSTPSRSLVNVKGNYFYNSWAVWFNCNTAGTVTENFSELSTMLTASPGTVFSGNTLSDGNMDVNAPDAQIKSNNFYGGEGISLNGTGATVTRNKFMYSVAINFNCYTAAVTGNTIIAGHWGLSGGAPYGNAPNTFVPSDNLINVPNLFYGSCP